MSIKDESMLVNARAVSLLLAVSVSAITTAFLALVPEVPVTGLVVAACLSFGTVAILGFHALDFLIFREVDRLYTGLDKLKRKELQINAKSLRSSSNPLRRINHEIVAYVSRKEREIDHLKKLEAYRKEFIANVSHELKTPIFAAQGYILTLLDGAMDDERVRERFLEKAANSLNGLDALVQDLLVLSQIESGMIKMNYQGFDLKAVCHEIFDQLEHKADARQATVRTVGPEPDRPQAPFYVNADASRIRQVLTNLIANALKYGKVGGTVEVRFAYQQSKALVEVSDDGPGIAKEHQARIFERFYRVDKSRSREQGGTGLGLAIAKHIVKEHGSIITLESGEGEGTTFSFKLERAKAPEKQGQAPESKTRQDSAASQA